MQGIKQIKTKPIDYACHISTKAKLSFRKVFGFTEEAKIENFSEWTPY